MTKIMVAFLKKKNKEVDAYDINIHGHNYEEFNKNAKIYRFTLMAMYPHFMIYFLI